MLSSLTAKGGDRWEESVSFDTMHSRQILGLVASTCSKVDLGLLKHRLNATNFYSNIRMKLASYQVCA